MSKRGLPVDTLFLAATRPAMWWGVPHEAMVINGMVWLIVFILAKNPLFLLPGIAVHFVVRSFISYDYNMFGVLLLWLNTKGRANDIKRWGGSTVSPLSGGDARHAREVRVHV